MVRSLIVLLFAWAAVLPTGAEEAPSLRIADATRNGDDAIRQIALACALANEELEISLERKPVSEALADFRAGKVDFAVLEARAVPEDLKSRQLIYAVEALVFYTAPSNSARNLTRAQAAKLLQEKRPVWSDFGGPRLDVYRIGIKDSSPVRGLAEALLLPPGEKFPTPAFSVRTTAEALLLAGSNPAGLAAGHFLPSLPATVRMLAVEGVEPGLKTVTGGRYPLTVFYALLAHPEETREKKILLRALRSGDFYDFLEESGRLAITPTPPAL